MEDDVDVTSALADTDADMETHKDIGTEETSGVDLGGIELTVVKGDDHIDHYDGPGLLECWRALRSPHLTSLGTACENLNDKMRIILLNWMCEVCHHYNHKRATMMLMVNLFDCAIAHPDNKTLSTKHLQRYGTTCISLASKFEEIYCADLPTLTHHCGGIYTTEEMKDQEYDTLRHMDYSVHIANPFFFISYWCGLLGDHDDPFYNTFVVHKAVANWLVAKVYAMGYNALTTDQQAAGALFLARYEMASYAGDPVRYRDMWPDYLDNSIGYRDALVFARTTAESMPVDMTEEEHRGLDACMLPREDRPAWIRGLDRVHIP